MGKMKKKQNKEEVAEDYCFGCKDGGHLRVCDFKNCVKSYHPSCVGEQPSLLESDQRWICGLHICMVCKKSSTFQCYCCPSAVCRSCIRSADFVQVKKKTKGFCGNCLKMTLMIEKNLDIDSDGEKVDFNARDTVEFLFMDYWPIVKEKEGLTLADLQSAQALLRKGDNYDSGSESEKYLEDDNLSDEDPEDEFEDEIPFLSDVKVGKSSGKARASLKRLRSKRRYLGWGSEELINFLKSTGKYTSEPMSQYDVSECVKQYIHSNNLFHPEKKKKKVVCDNRLYLLFRRKTIRLHKIYSLIENHLAENDDGFSFSSEEIDDMLDAKRVRGPNSGSKKLEPNAFKEKTATLAKGIYASMVDKNIQSIYLRRTLIVELMQSPAFEEKVVGCFVRVKNDRKDFYYDPQKPFQLARVTGIKNGPEVYKIGDTSTNIVLQVSNMVKDIPISILSDEDLEEQECEDLRRLVKEGLLKRPSVVELERKIRSVHEDIMNHWIRREIRKLDKMIERANEKGWRRELEDHCERKDLLQKPEERIRLMKDIPEVIVDTQEDTNVINSQDKGAEVINKAIPLYGMDGLHDDSIEAEVEETREVINKAIPTYDIDGFYTVSIEEAEVQETQAVVNKAIPTYDNDGFYAVSIEAEVQESQVGAEVSNKTIPTSYVDGIDSCTLEAQGDAVVGENAADVEASFSGVKGNDQDGSKGNVEATSQLTFVRDEAESMRKNIKDVTVIDLDDDDDCEPVDPTKDDNVSDNIMEIPEIKIPENQKIWHYIDLKGKHRGPFSMTSLKQWMEAGFFPDDFKVWRTGQTKERAILLTDAIHCTFH